MTYLLDVNVLIALVDPGHVAHNDAHTWFSKEGHPSWATCPITENGFVRILGNPKYPNSSGSPAVIAGIIEQMRALPGHCFWAGDFSLVGSDGTLELKDRKGGTRPTHHRPSGLRRMIR
ncbi:MAG: hypothetical protein ACU0CB_02180 [Roseovarius sp.]